MKWIYKPTSPKDLAWIFNVIDDAKCWCHTRFWWTFFQVSWIVWNIIFIFVIREWTKVNGQTVEDLKNKYTQQLVMDFISAIFWIGMLLYSCEFSKAYTKLEE